ncbi:hypothetical protein AH513_08960 [Salmonella enterica subsp. enterica serovar Montevideo]|nr:hypothetical protein [Salmonella enterica subsp. enterica serovar Montevideo]
MGSACRLSTNVIRLSKSISKHSLRSFLHCAECVFLAPSGSAKFIAFWCKKNRRTTETAPIKRSPARSLLVKRRLLPWNKSLRVKFHSPAR